MAKQECCSLSENKIAVRNTARSSIMRPKPSNTTKDGKKGIKLICIFPEESPENDTIKSEVRDILSIELKHQMQGKE